MANSQKTKKGPFDFLEKRIIFLVSRIFFWVLCIVAGLGFVVALILFLYNIIPPIKEDVAKPKLPEEVTISLAEIETAITPPPPKPKEERPIEVVKAPETLRPKEETKPAPPPPDPQQLTLAAKIDTLKSYFPAKKYTWTTERGPVMVRTDWWGNPVYETAIIKYGLDRHLNKVLELYEETNKKIDVVKELLAIIPAIAEDNRGKALEAYAIMRLKKEKDRKREIDEMEDYFEDQRRMAEMKYLEAKAKKAKGVGESLRILGASFVGIAIIGLFLCFLAIERNTRTMQALLEKEK